MIGVIGGTGLGDALGGLGPGQRHELDTPFGRPSGPIQVVDVAGVPVALLARHGEGHLLNPSRVPYRANIFALKQLGVTHILASGAVGSLREEIAPRELVLPDQVIDRTFRRAGTFFEDIAVHVELASPFCGALRAALGRCAPAGGVRLHDRGTYVCIEGPQLSTRAESDLYRGWGGDLIGMTLMPEAKLAREAEICYAAVALVTDYDCWRPHKAQVSQLRLLEEIISNMKSAAESALALIRNTIPTIVVESVPSCTCQSALELAIWSDRDKIDALTRERLAPLLGRYLA